MQPDPEEHTLQMTAIQLINVFPVKLYAAQFPMPKAEEPFSATPNLKLTSSISSSDERSYQVEIGGEVNFEALPHPFEIEVRIVGVFQTSDISLQSQDFVRWLEQNALHLLLPFLREAIFEMSLRLRLNSPVLLPLIDPHSTQLASMEEASAKPLTPTEQGDRPHRRKRTS